MLQRAILFHQRGQLAEAASLYLQLLKQNPEDAGVLHLLGVIELQKGNFPEAIERIDRAIAIDPNNAPFFSNRGIALRELKRFDAALASYDRALAIRPDYAEALNNRGLVLHYLNRFDEAVASYNGALAVRPDYAEAFSNRAGALHALKRLDEALDSYDYALMIRPGDPLAYYNRGGVLQELDRFEDALASYERALTLKPDYAEAHNDRGIALHRLKRFEEALAPYDQALAIRPEYPDVLINRANALLEMNRFDDALAGYERALALNPNHAEALNNRGNAFRGLGRYGDALASYDRALVLDPHFAVALGNRGIALHYLGRLDDALASYDRALAITPGLAQAHIGRGNVLRELRRFEDALGSYGRALKAGADWAEIHNNCGVVLQDVRRFGDALASYDRSLAIHPDSVETLINRASVLQDLKRPDDALRDYNRALAIRPDHALLSGSRLYCKMAICDWQGLAEDFDALAGSIGRGECASSPLPVLATPLSAALQRECAEIYVRKSCPENPILPPLSNGYGHSRIRLGYFSADFRIHPVAYLMAELFERHDRTQFEVTAFSLGSPTQDAMRARLEKSFDRFIDIDALSDKDVAMLARGLEIDIAIDLGGFTHGSRTGIFARRAAPIQINYLGFPGTMGAAYMDYLLADSTLIAEDERQHYTEKIVHLPDSYQANASNRSISQRRFSRAECGLPEKGFVFCCFNASYKITPAIFDVWMRLLGKVENSVLWLARSDEAAMSNLTQEAMARGIGANRLLFAPFLPDHEEHLARLTLADLFLDTIPFNAHASASDALWTGLPVLTCLGTTFPGRVAASLLRAAGLPELVTHDLIAYEALALELAAESQKLSALTQKLTKNRRTCRLFDTERFAKHIEAAFLTMCNRLRSGLAPEHFDVEAVDDPGHGKPHCA